MVVLRIILTSICAMATMFIMTKIVGNQQLSQLSLFDYINGITIGSIAAEMATSLEEPYKPFVAMIVFGLLSTLISLTTCKSVKMRRLIAGKPLILYENGKLYRKNLLSVRLNINELMTELRSQGYFDLADIHTAIFETNGKISVLPVAAKRPVTPEDMGISPQQETPIANVIMEGRIMEDNLRHTGNDKNWLLNKLNGFNVKNLSDVYLATCDGNNKLNVYIKIDEKMNRDIFQ